ncbi:hypothetical protein ACT7DZ_06835 [Bacillus cereus]
MEEVATIVIYNYIMLTKGGLVGIVDNKTKIISIAAVSGRASILKLTKKPFLKRPTCIVSEE